MGIVLHCSLLLLDYKSSNYDVDISPIMFDKANTKGFEAILHFLLTKARGTSQAKKARAYKKPVTAKRTGSLVRYFQVITHSHDCRILKAYGQFKTLDNREITGR